ncbi:aldose epimerase family protein [Colwellia psychrerythraea]|uniref:Aldose 1-epimerase n=1 Tax=Colwellia psychrerythraea TaxID=28229 RepID=A0A099K7Q6_COLPS|nr:aldose epimerase family protein [Colwellia psychrerythraea]KGJ86814.1 Aldose 1-epimerase [Colwellia psychrerythraea]
MINLATEQEAELAIELVSELPSGLPSELSLEIPSALVSKMETIVLTNNSDMSVEIINFGARIKSVKFPVHGQPTEMALGYASPTDYLTDEFYLGATCGRVCNRIAGGKFKIEGRHYQLPLNDGMNCLHGGADNFSLRYWQVCKQTLTNSSVTLLLVSPNGDQGFPGELNLSITYQLSEDNKLSIQYSANTDLATPINLTNHAYFNLGEKDCQSLYLQLMSSTLLETDAANIPTGNILSVAKSDYNFREPAAIGFRQQNSVNESLKNKNGYDHCFVLDNTPFNQPKAVLTSLKNQISLSVYTDQPAIQLYTGFYLSGQFSAYQGLCLEAQNYTDAENNEHFPSNILQPNQQYQRKIIYQFESIN